MHFVIVLSIGTDLVFCGIAKLCSLFGHAKTCLLDDPALAIDHHSSNVLTIVNHVIEQEATYM